MLVAEKPPEARIRQSSVAIMTDGHHVQPAPPTFARNTAASQPRSATTALERSFAFGLALIASVEAITARSLAALPEFDGSELPVEETAPIDAAMLQTAAVLYLAAELEAARLLPAVETVAGLFASGALRGDLGDKGKVLLDFWQQRSQRFARQEREAFFARMFGSMERVRTSRLAVNDSFNHDFEPLMIDLTDALYNFSVDAAQTGSIHTSVRLRLAAQRMIENLAHLGDGVASYIASDILQTIQQAVTILKWQEVQAAVGANSVWTALRNITRSYLQEEIAVSDHVERGKAGMLILAWLAANIDKLDELERTPLEVNDPVVTAASDWLQTSLRLQEQAERQTSASVSGEGR
ncbi:MAG: hypothetical protein KF716_32380 [Anaerolineae bacterium]|nr:hypothetical protein [Anaerolineae bacterium]